MSKDGAFLVNLESALRTAEKEELARADTLGKDEIMDDEHEAFYWHGYATALRNIRSAYMALMAQARS